MIINKNHILLLCVFFIGTLSAWADSAGETGPKKKTTPADREKTAPAKPGESPESSGLPGRAPDDRYLVYHYANDTFTATDRYFTQGIHAGYFDPWLKISPLMKLLISLPGEVYHYYGLFGRWDGFTPLTIRKKNIQVDERPFANFLIFGHLLISIDPHNKRKLTTELKIGIIGQATGGEETQEEIHRNIGGVDPLGWEHQVEDNFILDYQITLEHNLWSPQKWFEFNGYLDISLGTLYTYFALGSRIHLGKFESFANPAPYPDFPFKQLFFFFSLEARAMGYNATIQGGIFNRSDPHTLKFNELYHLVFQARVGLTLEVKGFQIDWGYSFISREYKHGKTHKWGYFNLIFKF